MFMHVCIYYEYAYVKHYFVISSGFLAYIGLFLFVAISFSPFSLFFKWGLLLLYDLGGGVVHFPFPTPLQDFGSHGTCFKFLW